MLRFLALSMLCLVCSTSNAQPVPALPRLDPVVAAPVAAAPKAVPVVVPVAAIPVAAAPVVAPAAPVVAPAVPAVTLMDNTAPVQVSEIVTNGNEIVAAIKAYKAAKSEGNSLANRIGIMVVLAAVFKTLLSILKYSTPWWRTDKAKNVIRLTTLAFGVAVFFVSLMAAGESWTHALLLSFSGPLAISINEIMDILLQLFKKTTSVPGGGAA